MDLTTRYLGMTLKNPLVPSASPLSGEIDSVRKMEDSGAAAVVLESLFEEQIIHESLELHHYTEEGTESYAEATSYFPEQEKYTIGPGQYLEQIRRSKEAVGIPIIASLCGADAGDWTGYAKQIEEAGADALELNIYYIPTDPNLPGTEVEKMYVETLKAVKSVIKIPVAVKLAPYFSNMAWMARQLDEAGADGLVLFNRFYQPDIDLERLEVQSNVLLSTPQARRVPLRWLAILCGQIEADLAATGAIHSGKDCLKMLMVGARVTQLCSTLYRHGIEKIASIEKEMVQWMEEHEYVSVEQMQGSMSQKSVENPDAFERAQFMKALRTFRND